MTSKPASASVFFTCCRAVRESSTTTIFLFMVPSLRFANLDSKRHHLTGLEHRVAARRRELRLRLGHRLEDDVQVLTADRELVDDRRARESREAKVGRRDRDRRAELN